MRRSQIALIGPIYPYRGGIAHFSETLYWQLLSRSHDVKAITFSRQYPAFLFPGRSQYEEGSVANPVPSVRLIDSLNPLTWYKAANEVIRSGVEYAIIPYWTPFLAPALGTIARRLKRRGVKVLGLVHNALPHERRPGDKFLGHYFLSSLHGCIVMSEEVEHSVKSLGVKVPTKRLYLPVYEKFGLLAEKNVSRAQLDIPADASVMLFFGFVRAYKGLWVLLKSMPRIISAIPDICLVIAGEFYEGEEEYRAIIESKDLEGHVILHDFYVAEADVKKYFAAANLIVQPYTTATQSGVAQMAFHFEKPLIITDVGGLAEIVGHEKAGFVVPPEDPDALADSVIRFFQEQWEDRLIEGVRLRKRTHSWENYCDELESLL